MKGEGRKKTREKERKRVSFSHGSGLHVSRVSFSWSSGSARASVPRDDAIQRDPMNGCVYSTRGEEEEEKS